jgi:hypothetical protein
MAWFDFCGDTLAIKYATERVTIEAGQLASWRAWVDGQSLRLAGRCPACAHDCTAEVPRQIIALEAVAAPRALTVAVTCQCGQPHSGRPDGLAGCGRRWSCTATSDENNAVALSPLADPTLVAAAEALSAAGAAQLTGIRGAAEKWIGGVTAIFSLFGLAGITITRTTLAGVSIWWHAGIAAAAAASISLAGLAVYRIYRAAYGWPVTYPVTDDDELRDWYTAQRQLPGVQAGYLRDGVRAAGTALAVLVVTAGLLWFAPQQQAAAPLVQATLTDGSRMCGTPLPATGTGTLRIRRAGDGTAVDIPLRLLTGLTAVAAC